MRRLAFSMLAAMTSCAYSVHHTPAPTRPAAVRVFERPFDDVWSAVVGWFASSNISLDKVEKASGLLTAKYPLATNDNAVDIGKVESSGFWAYGDPEVTNHTVNLNVFARQLGPQSTEVTVNVFGSFEARVWWGLLVRNDPPSLYTGRSESRGVIEASVFAHVERLLAQ